MWAAGHHVLPIYFILYLTKKNYHNLYQHLFWKILSLGLWDTAKHVLLILCQPITVSLLSQRTQTCFSKKFGTLRLCSSTTFCFLWAARNASLWRLHPNYWVKGLHDTRANQDVKGAVCLDTTILWWNGLQYWSSPARIDLIPMLKLKSVLSISVNHQSSLFTTSLISVLQASINSNQFSQSSETTPASSY